jgi:hypothetical protein
MYGPRGYPSRHLIGAGLQRLDMFLEGTAEAEGIQYSCSAGETAKAMQYT